MPHCQQLHITPPHYANKGSEDCSGVHVDRHGLTETRVHDLLLWLQYHLVLFSPYWLHYLSRTFGICQHGANWHF